MGRLMRDRARGGKYGARAFFFFLSSKDFVFFSLSFFTREITGDSFREPREPHPLSSFGGPFQSARPMPTAESSFFSSEAGEVFFLPREDVFFGTAPPFFFFLSARPLWKGKDRTTFFFPLFPLSSPSPEGVDYFFPLGTERKPPRTTDFFPSRLAYEAT